jgi:hypothetical protein
MAIPFYDVSVASYLQTLGGVAGFLDRGLAHYQDNGLDPDTLVDARLFEDMAPLSFQIHSVAHHSIGALKGIEAGAFGPPPKMEPTDYRGLQTKVTDAQAALKALDPDAVNALEGGDVIFQIGQFKMPFTAPGFLLSFSIPNFQFHATTAYDILRSRGVPIGKRDYLGAMRFKA